MNQIKIGIKTVLIDTPWGPKNYSPPAENTVEIRMKIEIRINFKLKSKFKL